MQETCSAVTEEALMPITEEECTYLRRNTQDWGLQEAPTAHENCWLFCPAVSFFPMI